MRIEVLLSVLLGLALPAGEARAQEKPELPPVAKDSGFAWLDGEDSIAHTVEREAVKKGLPRKGHPRDLIPPIDQPAFYGSPKEAEKEFGMKAEERILGIVVGDDARAYPTRILDRHEIANDTVGGKPLAVVW
jgi:hypothetical protein